MDILNLDHCRDILDTCSSKVSQIIGGKRRKLTATYTNAETDDGVAIADAGAVAIGTYSNTYTSTRTSSRSNRHGSYSVGAAGAYASARLGSETDVSSSSDVASYISD